MQDFTYAEYLFYQKNYDQALHYFLSISINDLKYESEKINLIYNTSKCYMFLQMYVKAMLVLDENTALMNNNVESSLKLNFYKTRILLHSEKYQFAELKLAETYKSLKQINNNAKEYKNFSDSYHLQYFLYKLHLGSGFKNKANFNNLYNIDLKRELENYFTKKILKQAKARNYYPFLYSTIPFAGYLYAGNIKKSITCFSKYLIAGTACTLLFNNARTRPDQKYLFYLSIAILPGIYLKDYAKAVIEVQKQHKKKRKKFILLLEEKTLLSASKNGLLLN